LQRDWDGMMRKEASNFKKFFEGYNVEKVIDASCGSGEQSMALASLGLEVTACDPSAGLVEQTALNAKKYNVQDKLVARQSDFLNLANDFAPETFDAVVTKGSSLPHLHTNADLLQACKNFYTILKPGGANP
jgi:glycine/sarcosine N-methyltransferase